VAGRIEPNIPPSEAALPPGLSAVPDLGALLRALRRRWIAAVSLGGSLAVVAALAAWFLLSPKYTAFAKIRVASDDGNLLPTSGGPKVSYATYQATQAAQLISRPVIVSALKSEEVKRLNLEARETDPVAYLEEELKVEFKDNNEMLTLTMNSPDPAVSVAVVKAVTAAYMENIVYAEHQARAGKVSELEKVYADTGNKLNQDKINLQKLGKSLGVADPAVWAQQQIQVQESIRDSRGQRNSIAFELLKAESDLAMLEVRAKALEGSSIPDSALEAALDADPDAKALSQRIERLEEIVQGYDDTPARRFDPTPMAARQRLASLRVRLDKRRARVKADLKRRAETGTHDEIQLTRAHLVNKINALKEQHEKLKADVEQQVAQLTRINGTSTEHEALRAEIDREEKVVNTIGVHLAEEKVELRRAERITVFQEADLQKKDMKKQVLATITAPLGVLFAVCTALAWGDCRQRRVRSAEELARGLGIRVVGAVPDLPDLERQLVGPGGEPALEGHPVLESIDAIRTLLLQDADARGTRRVLVTSANAGEGKTTLAAHLAGSLARAGRKTLLVDGDLRRPSAHELFELPVQPGFSEVLLGEVEVADAVQATSLDGLALMPAGQWDREVLQALARDGLEGILEKLQEEFDFIIIDSHPVLAATDALLIGLQADAVILSVLREVSEMPRVYAAAQRLAVLGIRVLGAVVNGTDPNEVFATHAHAHVA
jgi:capsular exopolysaccharide synthesis family protein